MVDRRAITILLPALLAALALSACANVLRTDLVKTGARNVSPVELARNPDIYRGRLFIFGGTIVGTAPVPGGTLIDALYVPVDASGYLKHVEPAGRFIAVYPKEGGVIERTGRYGNMQITLAGVFTGIEAGRTGNAAGAVPVFRVEQLYLWPTDLYYTYYYGDSGCRGPYWGPYWGTYWGLPWWPHLYPLCSCRDEETPVVDGRLAKVRR